MRNLNIIYRITSWIIYIMIGYRVLQLVFALFTLVEVQKTISGSGNVDSLEFIDSVGVFENIVGNAIAVGLGISFLVWFYLSYKKAQRRRTQSFSYKPILALFSFIIPVFNLFAPYKIMHEIWAAENRDPSQEQNGRKLINMWWFLSLIIFVYYRICNYKFKHITELEQLVTAEYYYIPFYMVSIHYFFALIKLMGLISSEQNYQKDYPT